MSRMSQNLCHQIPLGCLWPAGLSTHEVQLSPHLDAGQVSPGNSVCSFQPLLQEGEAETVASCPARPCGCHGERQARGGSQGTRSEHLVRRREQTHGEDGNPV